MKGQDIFNQLTSKRDFSGDEHDQYAQLLMTIFMAIGNDIYPMLEVAEEKGKKLSLEGKPDEIRKDDIIFV